ncbi:hypothetical protein [Kineococcus gypseus]|uniref:hypothetical protein n=1 Tax=Kineococcus gypseus TaxID=1637102 RepID=UPI003D7D81CA
MGQVHATPEPSAAVLGEEPADRLAVPAFGVVGDCVRVDGGLRELGERLAAVLEAPFDEAAAAALDEYLTGQGRRAAVQAWTRLNEGSAGAEQEAEHQEAEHQASWTSSQLLAQLREQPGDGAGARAQRGAGARGASGARFTCGRSRRARWGMGGVAC